MTDVREEPTRMLPAESYTSTEVLDWERRHLFAASWTCLGRPEDLLPTAGAKPVTQRAVMVGDVACVLVRDEGGEAADVPEHLPAPRPRAARAGRHVDAAQHPVPLPRVDLRPRRVADRCPGLPRGPDVRRRRARAGRAARAGVARLGVRARAAPAGQPVGPVVRAPTSARSTGLLAPYDAGALVLADRHTYEVAANWKVIAENYHECYHCPLIHPELCEVTPPDSGVNYRLPGAWIGGSMDLREGTSTDVARPARWRPLRCPTRTRGAWSTCTCCRTCWSPRTPTT